MNSREKQILSEGKYLAKRVMYKYALELYLWEDRFYEVTREYGQDKIDDLKRLEDKAVLDLYIQAMNRTGEPRICIFDKTENLRAVGKQIQPILKKDHPAFLKQLYWDQKLHWFCEVIEVRAAYLVDDILPKTKGMLVSDARDIAIGQLLENPQKQMKPPYIKLLEGDYFILLPWWTMNRYSQQEIRMEDIHPLGNGIEEVLGVIDAFGGWENATGEQYWEEQKDKMQTIRKKHEQGKRGTSET